MEVRLVNCLAKIHCLVGWLVDNLNCMKNSGKKASVLTCACYQLKKTGATNLTMFLSRLHSLQLLVFPSSVESKHLGKKSCLVYFLFLKAHYYYVNLPAGAFKDALTSSTKHYFLLTVNRHTHPYLVPLPDSNSHGKSGTWKKRHAQTLPILVRQTQVQTAGNQSPEKTCKHRHRHRKPDVGITLISQM